MKSIVTSLELSKRLKESWIERESILVWEEYDRNMYTYWREEDLAWKVFERRKRTPKSSIPAYTASELIDMLPIRIWEYKLSIMRFYNMYYIGYDRESGGSLIEYKDTKIEEALGQVRLSLSAIIDRSDF